MHLKMFLEIENRKPNININRLMQAIFTSETNVFEDYMQL